MLLFELFLAIYFGIGFIYALYVLLFAADAWYWFLVNMAFGPITLIYNAYRVAKRTKRII